MFGRGKKKDPGFGLGGLVRLPPDGPVAPPVPVPVSEPAGCTPRRQAGSGVVVWRAAGPDLVAAWTAARDRHPRTGLWPVLVGAGFWERFDDEGPDPTPDRGDGRAWLEGRLADGDLAGQVPRRAGDAWHPVPAAGWADLLEPVDELVLVPAAASWLALAAFGWDGAVNADVLGPEHTTVLRRWSAAYGAEVMVVGSDVLTLRLARPPADRDAALRAAVEVVAYCPDAVFQGAGTLEDLAETLTAPAWHFWWD